MPGILKTMSPLVGDIQTSEVHNAFVEKDKVEPIAVIGFSLRFPQDAVSADSFWRMMMEGRCAMTEIPEDRMNSSGFYHPDSNRPDTIPFSGGHFLKGNIAAFDAPFFSIAAADAAAMDPQQRILLETAYRALENAGLPLRQVAGSKTSVHTGCMTDDYKMMGCRDPEQGSNYAAAGVAFSMLANRLSWFYNLSGPSINLDSACSSSLVALDLACQGLRNKDTDMGLVAGCSLTYNPDWMLLMSNMGLLSHDSRCFSFDHRANGYARGEGFAVVVVKRLADAIQDGNVIRAVIRATGSNQDGFTPGITNPNQDAQERLIRDTYKKANLDMHATRYFESHGTGTAVGDPTEANALGKAFRKKRSQQDPMYIGAVKSNIGHLEGASGLAGLIKAILVLERAVIPPNTNFERLNPKIDVDYLRIKFPQEALPWPTDGLRRASVNSFGFGGANSHVVLDDAYSYLRTHNLIGNHRSVGKPPPLWTLRCPLKVSEDSPSTNGDFCLTTNGYPQHLTNGSSVDLRPTLLLWSASDEDGLERLASAYGQHFAHLSLNADRAEAYLKDLAYTLNLRRSSLSWKSFMVVESSSQLQNLHSHMSKPVRCSITPRIGFVFTGQGAQWHAMGRELLFYPVFRSSLQRSELFLVGFGCQWLLIDELLKDEVVSNVNLPNFSQPLCTALQIALIDLLRHFGTNPSAVVGHSSGEIAAAYCVGALSSKSACKIAYYRGMLAATLANQHENRGGMLAVGLSKDEILPYLDRVAHQFEEYDLVVACINSHRNITISGGELQIDALKVLLDGNSIFSRKLLVDVAYHSPRMKVIASEYLTAIGDLQMENPSLAIGKMISSVSAREASVQELCDGQYWVQNMISPVRFSEALQIMCARSRKTIRRKLDRSHQDIITVEDIVEIGPHSALRGSVRDSLKVLSREKEVRYSSALVRNMSARKTILELIGHLHCLGYGINLSHVNSPDTDSSNVPIILTDLPEYPFNHSKPYWLESRVSRGYRFRKTSRLDLLGSRVLDWSHLEPRWRNFIKVSELSWIEDHKINGSLLYPAAGMLVMAIEAANQVADGGQTTTGFSIQNVVFHTPLHTSLDPSGVETMTSLRSLTATSDKLTTVLEFRLYFHRNDEWTEACRGTIQVHYHKTYTGVDEHKRTNEQKRYYKDIYEDALRACTRTVDSKGFYKHLEKCGFNYGPAFQPLKLMTCNDEYKATANVELYQWLPDRNISNHQPHIIHPTTLDGLMQLVFVALTKGGTDAMATMVPTKIRRLWLSSSRLSHPASNEIRAVARSAPIGYRGTQSSVYAFSKTDGDLLVELEGLDTTVVAGSEPSSQGGSQGRQLCCHLRWEPDVSLLSKRQTSAYCERSHVSKVEPVEFYQDLEDLLKIFISEISNELVLKNLHQLKPYLRKYVTWILLQQESLREETSQDELLRRKSNRHDSCYREYLSDCVQKSNKQGETYVLIGKNLIRILRGEIDPLKFLAKVNPVKDLYQNMDRYINCFNKAQPYLRASAHRNPDIKILELGAGIGGATEFFLRSFSAHEDEKIGTARYAEYDFTDISSSFFEKAQETFKDHKRMRFKTLDITNNPTEQGYDPGTYDLIVAANVLHATRDLSTTLLHIHKLLKPHGKLVLLEITRPGSLRSGFIFGLLPEWWLASEGYREWSPCLSPEKWHDVLTQQGFSGTDVVLHDFQNEQCQELSLIVSTALSQIPNSMCQWNFVIIAKEDVGVQRNIATKLQFQLRSSGSPSCEISTLHEVVSNDNLSEAVYICLLEFESSLLRELDLKSYTALQRLLVFAKCVIWVSSSQGPSSDTPENSMVIGLARVLRTELNSLSFVTLALESKESGMEADVQSILDVSKSTIDRLGDKNYESTYVEMHGALHIPRVVKASHLSHECFTRGLAYHSSIQIFGEDPPLQMTMKSPGFLDTLSFIEDTEYDKLLSNGEVEVEVKAIGLNFSDSQVAAGRSDEMIFGNECSGIVSRVDRECNLQPGDRVCVAGSHMYKNFIRSRPQSVATIPDELSFVEAATLPTAFVTAYYALQQVARMEIGESILIQSCAGKVGQAAVQISNHFGVEIFATVDSDEERKLLSEAYNVPDDHIFYRSSASLAKGIKRMTKNRGVDIVFCWSINEEDEDLDAYSECIAAYGRFIDTYPRRKVPSLDSKRNVSFSLIDVAAVIEERPLLIQKTLTATLALIKAKKLHSLKPLHVYPISEVRQAFEFAQREGCRGSIVIEANKHDLVPTILRRKSSYRFDENWTYLISGGLGGVGRRIARWMVSRGARHLILLSRSGPRSQAAITLLKELASEGARVEAPSCDIINPESLKSILEHLTEVMPPIKGCIQAAMILRDSLFQNMSYEDWKASIEPKVHGSWNLHNLLPQGMDFFVMLSSITGIVGQGGQANYAAGNTYEDALAHYRVTHGEKAVSIDLGVMVSDGVVAENRELRDRLLGHGLYIPLSHKELLALLDYYCDPALDLLTPQTCQAIIGIETPARLRAQGIEEASWMRTPLFRHMYHIDGYDETGTTTATIAGVSSSETSDFFAKQFAVAKSLSEAGTIVTEGLIKKLAKSLVSLGTGTGTGGGGSEDVDVNKPLHHYGVDSLLAVELRNWIAKTFEADVPVFEILGGATFLAVGLAVARKSGFKKGEWME